MPLKRPISLLRPRRRNCRQSALAHGFVCSDLVLSFLCTLPCLPTLTRSAIHLVISLRRCPLSSYRNSKPYIGCIKQVYTREWQGGERGNRGMVPLLDNFRLGSSGVKAWIVVSASSAPRPVDQCSGQGQSPLRSKAKCADASKRPTRPTQEEDESRRPGGWEDDEEGRRRGRCHPMRRLSQTKLTVDSRRSRPSNIWPSPSVPAATGVRQTRLAPVDAASSRALTSTSGATLFPPTLPRTLRPLIVVCHDDGRACVSRTASSIDYASSGGLNSGGSGSGSKYIHT